MAVLRFNSAAAAQGFYDILSKNADKYANSIKSEIESRLKTSDGKGDIELISENQFGRIRREIIAGAYAIMDSYGTGTKMDKNNSALSDYVNSELWNTLRSGSYAIVGRKQGEYTNIFGEKEYSTGRMAGRNLEGRHEPLSPSYAIQNAEKLYFSNEKITELIKESLDEWVKGMSNYFMFS